MVDLIRSMQSFFFGRASYRLVVFFVLSGAGPQQICLLAVSSASPREIGNGAVNTNSTPCPLMVGASGVEALILRHHLI
jgi:hypothetical protein